MKADWIKTDERRIRGSAAAPISPESQINSRYGSPLEETI